MATKKSSKAPLRKARESDRELAAELAERLKDRFGPNCSEDVLDGKEGDKLPRSYPRSSKDEVVDMAVGALEYFATYGTFHGYATGRREDPELLKLLEQCLAHAVERLHDSGSTYEAAIETIAKQTGKSKQTVANALYGRKKPKT